MLRTCLVIGMLSLVVERTMAQEGDEKAKAIFQKAVKAHGGVEALKKFKAATWSDTGTYYGMGQGFPYKGEYKIQWPDSFHMEIEGAFTVCLHKGAGWTNTGGQVTDLKDDALDSQKTQMYIATVTTLTPIMGKGFKVAVVGDAEVNGKPAVEIAVTKKGQPDVNLSFDKKSGLLAKASYSIKSSEKEFKEVTEVTIYKDYKLIDGLMTPMAISMTRDGEKYLESKTTEFSYNESLDAATFKKPN